jgi:hypothetical protein
MNPSRRDSPVILEAAARRLFMRGEYHGNERTFEGRCAALSARAEALGADGKPVLLFIRQSVEAYEPILRAIHGIGILIECVAGASHDWRPVVQDVRGHLRNAGERYCPEDVHHTVANLTAILADAVRELETKAAT